MVLLDVLDAEIPALSGTDVSLWEPYYQKAFELGIVSNTDKLKFPEPITRFEAALHYYRLFVRYKFLQNYEQDTASINNVLTVFDDSSTNQELNLTIQKKIAINADKLFDMEGRV